MKKTLLAVALLFASAGVFAQVNVNNNSLDVRHAATSVSGEQLLKTVKKSAVKGTAEGAEVLCSFKSGTYTIGTTANHTAAGEYANWKIVSDTNSTWDEGTWMQKNFWGTATPGHWYIIKERANMSVEDGFAYINFLALMDVDKANNSTFDAWIKPNTSIRTYGLRGLDIYVSQWCSKFNQDQYFLEWSHDPDFTVKDSIEFNLRDVEATANDFFNYGTFRINIPNTPNCPVISTDPEEETYIRIRVSAPPSEDQPHGYIYLLDDIAWKETDYAYLTATDISMDGSYYRIPEIVKPNPIFSYANVANTGVATLTDVTLKNLMVKATIVSDDSLYYDFNAATSNEGTIDTLTNEAYETTVRDANNNDVTVLRRYYEIQAYSTGMLNEGTGPYSIHNILTYSYKDGEDQMKTDTIESDLNYYYRVDGPASEEGSYIWARDQYATNTFFGEGFVKSGNYAYITNASPQAITAGYKVCLGYNAEEYQNESVYAWGIEVVPAADTCVAGVYIKGSLAEADITVGNADDIFSTIVESDAYAVQTSDLNTTPAGEQYINNPNSIYLPFTSQGTLLEPGRFYYACYELVTAGKFLAGKSLEYLNSFGPGYTVFSNGESESLIPNLIIYTPGISGTANTFQYGWGNFYRNADLNPMVRLVVAPTKGGLNEVAQSNATVNVYPNPVADHFRYTLPQSGNVTINITDIMGRTVVSENVGNQTAGIEYKKNIGNLANGTYFCTFNVNGAKVATTKLVVNK